MRLSLSFLFFYFLVNTAYLFKGYLPLSVKLEIFVIYTFLTLNYYLVKLFKVKTLKFLGFTIDGFDYSDLYLLFGEIFVRGCYYFQSDRKNPVIVDCGSNIGMSILFFKYIYPNAKVYSFEPDPDTYKTLRKNIRTNKLSEIVSHNIALSKKKGDTYLYRDSIPGKLFMSIVQDRGLKTRVKVKKLPLSHFLKNEKVVDFLKLDVEGSEFAVLENLNEEKLIGRIKEMVVEYHHNVFEENGSFGKVLNLLEALHYDYQIDTYNVPLYKKKAFQDILIYAHRN